MNDLSSTITHTWDLAVRGDRMSCEGVWKVEVKDPYGWERVPTAFMKNGEYPAASANHYTVGSYREEDDAVEITALVTQYGDMHTVFGKKQAHQLMITSRCKIENNTKYNYRRKQGKRRPAVRYPDTPYQA